MRAAPSRPLAGQRMGHFRGWPKCYQNGRVLAHGQKRAAVPQAELHSAHPHALWGRVSPPSLLHALKQINRLKKPAPAAAPVEPPTDVKLLGEIRDLLASKR